jgi:hypothetical protein
MKLEKFLIMKSCVLDINKIKYLKEKLDKLKGLFFFFESIVITVC